jgi:hypothetical protein
MPDKAMTTAGAMMTIRGAIKCFMSLSRSITSQLGRAASEGFEVWCFWRR